MKRRRTTPSSATLAAVSGSAMSEKPKGPMMTPATRYPSTALCPMRRKIGTPITAADRKVSTGGRKLTWVEALAMSIRSMRSGVARGRCRERVAVLSS